METSYRGLDYESGKAIQRLRNAIGLTQVGLAEYLGVSVRTVKEWEAGGSYPKTERLKALIVLAIQYQAWPCGCEAKEILALWKTTHQKRLLNEDWLSALLAGPLASQEQRENTLRPDAAPGHGATLVPANAGQDMQFTSSQEQCQEVLQPHVTPPHRVTLVPANASLDTQFSASDLDKPVGTAVGQGDREGSAVQRPRRVLAGQAQNRPRMLRQLGRTYRELMDQSLQGATWLELGLTYKPDAVQNAANLLWRGKSGTEQYLPAGTSIGEAYDEAGYELLILGEPGSGKSTLLLDLAHQLVLRAEADETHPLPMILPLSIWAAKRLKLEDWIAEQMCEIYDVPRTLSAQWMHEDAILPLLDGLDEMEETLRPTCITAINAYRSSHRPPLVVCSRKAEYETAAEQKRLKLQSAVVVQPLTQAQVERYLVQMGKPLTTLHTTLKEHPTLQELVTTPLMLNVLILTYRETGVDHLPDTQAPLQEQVWTDYVARMVEHKGNARRYPHARTVSYLRWLAQQMQRRNQTIFYLEHLQPDWLDARGQRIYSWWAVRLSGILTGILVSALIVWYVFDMGPDYPSSYFQYAIFGGLLGILLASHRPEEPLITEKNTTTVGTRTGASPVPTAPVRTAKLFVWKHVALSLLFGLLLTCSFGLDIPSHEGLWDIWFRDSIIFFLIFGPSCMLIQFFVVRSHSAHIPTKPSHPTRGWKRLVHSLQTVQIKLAMITAAMVGLSYGLSYGLTLGPDLGLNFGLLNGLDQGLTLGWSYGLSCALIDFILRGQTENIQLTERFRWSWSGFSKSLFRINRLHVLLLLISSDFLVEGLRYGVLFWMTDAIELGPAFGLQTGLYSASVSALIIGLVYWLLSSVSQGVTQERIEDQDRRVPNEGTHRSLHNGIMISLISGGIIGAIIGATDLLSWVLAAILILPATIDHNLISALNTTLSYTLNQEELFYLLRIAILGGSLVFMAVGGLAVWRHCVIRLLLWRSHTFPGRAPQFLNDASARFLLRRVGGGYSFIHRLLLEYFVATRESDM